MTSNLIKKIAFVGNGCTGKTTCAFEVVKQLKLAKRRVGYVNDVCRNVPFNPSKFDTEPMARLHALFGQLHQETAQICRDDVEFLVTERTAMDWCLYYGWTLKNIDGSGYQSVLELVDDWALSYDLVYYLEDTIDYVDDGFRPASTKLRDEMSAFYAAWRENVEDTPLAKRIIDVKHDEVADRVEFVGGHVLQWVEENHGS